MTAQAASLEVSIRRDGASINGTPLGTAGPVSQLHAVFGTPDRIIEGSPTPAPVGHRNNQFHYYDAQGVTLNEHHYTYQIQSINFVFDTGLSDHPTRHAFHGEMTVGGLGVVVGTLERELSNAGLKFTARLPGTWYTRIPSSVEGKAITVTVSTLGPRLKSGRRSKTKVIVSVSLCLPHDPWNTAHIPRTSSKTKA